MAKTSTKQSVVIVGGGTMGRVLVRSLGRAGLATKKTLLVVEHDRKKRALLAKAGIRTTHDLASLSSARRVLLAIKPQDFSAMKKMICVPRTACVISIMAGVPTQSLLTLGSQAVVRAMPNTPAQIGKGVTVWTATRQTGTQDRAFAKRLFAKMGEELFIVPSKNADRMIDAATALSGSGPAYFFLFLESLVSAGVKLGFSRAEAKKLVMGVAKGAIALTEESGEELTSLRVRVTSKGGTTEAALETLKKKHFSLSVGQAVFTAFTRARKLSKK